MKTWTALFAVFAAVALSCVAADKVYAPGGGGAGGGSSSSGSASTATHSGPAGTGGGMTTSTAATGGAGGHGADDDIDRQYGRRGRERRERDHQLDERHGWGRGCGLRARLCRRTHVLQRHVPARRERHE